MKNVAEEAGFKLLCSEIITTQLIWGMFLTFARSGQLLEQAIIFSI
jgi:hypothetical protein